MPTILETFGLHLIPTSGHTGCSKICYNIGPSQFLVETFLRTKKREIAKRKKGPKAAKLRNENKGMAKLRDRLN